MNRISRVQVSRQLLFAFTLTALLVIVMLISIDEFMDEVVGIGSVVREDISIPIA